jgi:hypothetical protein
LPEKQAYKEGKMGTNKAMPRSELIRQTRRDSLAGTLNPEDDIRLIEGLPIGLAISLPLWAIIILAYLAIF